MEEGLYLASCNTKRETPSGRAAERAVQLLFMFLPGRALDFGPGVAQVAPNDGDAWWTDRDMGCSGQVHNDSVVSFVPSGGPGPRRSAGTDEVDDPSR